MSDRSRPWPRVARGAVTVAVLAALGLALAARRDEVRGQLGLVSAQAVAGAFAYSVLGLLASMLAWRSLLADLGSPLPVRAAGRVLFLGQLAQYRPGSRGWPVGRTGLADDVGVPRSLAAAAALVFTLVTVGVGLLVALLALPRLLPDGAPHWLRWSPLLLPVGLAWLTPPVLSRTCTALFRLLRRPRVDVRLSFTGVGTAVLALLGTWLAYGLQVTLLGWSLGADPAGLLLPATGAFAAAWCAGFLVPVVPAGAGIREAVLTVALAAQLPGGAAAALAVAVLSRLLLTAADVVAGLVGLLLGRRSPAAPAGWPLPAQWPPGQEPPPGHGLPPAGWTGPPVRRPWPETIEQPQRRTGPAAARD